MDGERREFCRVFGAIFQSGIGNAGQHFCGQPSNIRNLQSVANPSAGRRENFIVAFGKAARYTKGILFSELYFLDHADPVAVCMPVLFPVFSEKRQFFAVFALYLDGCSRIEAKSGVNIIDLPAALSAFYFSP